MATLAERPFVHRAETLTGGASAEVIGGIGAIVLAILGLAHVAPDIVIPIASIVVGAAFVLESGAMAVEYSRLVGVLEAGQHEEAGFGGLSIKVLAGFVGIVLGVLALIGLSPMVLTSVSAVVFGTALTLSGPMAVDFEALEEGTAKRPQPVMRGLAAASVAVQMVSGLGVTIMGILALTGLHATTLVLVSLLVLGLGILVNGPAMNGKLLSMAGWE